MLIILTEFRESFMVDIVIIGDLLLLLDVTLVVVYSLFIFENFSLCPGDDDLNKPIDDDGERERKKKVLVLKFEMKNQISSRIIAS